MSKKLTITVSDEVYKDLHQRVGRRKISRFINDLAREQLADRNSPEFWLSAPERELADAYAEQAAHKAAQADEMKKQDEAWLNGLIGDVLRTDRANEKG
jgi:predicted CopG family antitoxin